MINTHKEIDERRENKPENFDREPESLIKKQMKQKENIHYLKLEAQ